MQSTKFASARKKPVENPVRAAVLVRWMALVDDLVALEDALKDAAADGAFSAKEAKAAEVALNSAWELLANERPEVRG